MPASILIADDDRLVRTMLRDILVEAGHRPLEAGDGRETLEALERDKPDLVLLDLLMPEVSGLEVLERVGQISPKTRVLIITSMDTERLMYHALASGAHGYLGKPFHPLEISEAVAKALEP